MEDFCPKVIVLFYVEGRERKGLRCKV